MNINLFYTGKALKISKKPCADPSGRKGVCTFKWDCINNNGTLMGTCVDGFIFGTCCQYDSDPLLQDQYPLLQQESNKISDEHKFIFPPSTRRSSSTTTTSTTIPPTTTTTTIATRRPVQLITLTTKRPRVTTVKPETASVSNTSTGQLVTWTSIGPTRRPVPQRPIIIQPFPFRPGLTIPNFQGGWPLGIAIPVDPTQINRPFQVFRPPVLLQSAQNNIVSQVPANSGGNVSYTILNGPDKTTQKTTSTTKKAELTTISVPIPQWSTQSPASIQHFGSSTVRTTIRPLLLTSSNFSTAGQSTSISTGRPLKTPPLDYRKGIVCLFFIYKN